MKRDRLIAILHLLANNIEHPSSAASACGGICGYLIELLFNKLITEEEKEYVYKLLYANKPNHEQYVEFTFSEWWTNGSFWWKPLWKSNDARAIRAEFVRAVIRKYNIEDDE